MSGFRQRIRRHGDTTSPADLLSPARQAEKSHVLVARIQEAREVLSTDKAITSVQRFFLEAAAAVFPSLFAMNADRECKDDDISLKIDRERKGEGIALIRYWQLCIATDLGGPYPRNSIGLLTTNTSICILTLWHDYFCKAFQSDAVIRPIDISFLGDRIVTVGEGLTVPPGIAERACQKLHSFVRQEPYSGRDTTLSEDMLVNAQNKAIVTLETRRLSDKEALNYFRRPPDMTQIKFGFSKSVKVASSILSFSYLFDVDNSLKRIQKYYITPHQDISRLRKVGNILWTPPFAQDLLQLLVIAGVARNILKEDTADGARLLSHPSTWTSKELAHLQNKDANEVTHGRLNRYMAARTGRLFGMTPLEV